jgi:hypothetical protein
MPSYMVFLIVKNMLYQPKKKEIRFGFEKHYQCDYAD